MSALTSDRGFTLIETLLALAVLAGALVTLGQLIATGAAQASAARRTTTALVLAQSKLDELRALPFRFAVDGSRVDSAALAVSADTSLTEDVAGWIEALDRFGAVVNDRRLLHYRRRWSVRLLNGIDVDTLVLQVCVLGPGA